MEFLVRQEDNRPAQMRRDAQIQEAERSYDLQLRQDGILSRRWSLPGTRATLTLYEVADATVLHDVLLRMPMFQWLTISVDALADYPQDGPHRLPKAQR